MAFSLYIKALKHMATQALCCLALQTKLLYNLILSDTATGPFSLFFYFKTKRFLQTVR